MRIFRFDPEVSVGDSGCRVAALTGPDSRTQTQLLHIGPGGGFGPARTRAQKFVGVVTGAGWVGAAGGDRRQLTVGYGALWDAGELHEAGTEDGLTAVCVEGEFEVWATAVTQDIVVDDYNPEWPVWFDQISAVVWPAVRDVALRIEHVGSTSVPGLAAKPVIDMDIVVADDAGVAAVVERLGGIGYRHRGDLGVTGRQAFARPGSSDLPAHHLYAVVENNKAHVDHWLLRDVLREDAGARDQYASLKRRNVDLAGGDMDVYVAAKASFVAQILTAARAARGLPAEEYWEPPA